MTFAVFDRVTAQAGLTSLPVRLHQSASRVTTLARLLMVLPAVLALSVPMVVLVSQAIAEPNTMSVVAQRPLAALQIGIGLVIWGAIFLIPTSRVVKRFWTSRQVDIVDGTVRVEERTIFGRRTWSRELGEYLGLAHHIRASMSGLVHEIVLVHPDRARSVTLMIADRVTQTELDAAKTLLGLPEVPPRLIYESDARRQRQATTTQAGQSVPMHA